MKSSVVILRREQVMTAFPQSLAPLPAEPRQQGKTMPEGDRSRAQGFALESLKSKG